MRSRILRRGGSSYLLLPDSALEQSGLGGEVEIELRGKEMVIRPIDRGPRTGWDSAFREMALRGDDALLDPDTGATDFDRREWGWWRGRRSGRSEVTWLAGKILQSAPVLRSDE